MKTINRILVPTDFSEPALRALRYAGELAFRTGAHLNVIYADRFLPPLDFTIEAGAWDRTTAELLEKRARTQIAIDIKACVDAAVAAEANVRLGTAAASILEEARRWTADLIVMGTHGRTGLPRLVLGSVTEEVMRKTSVPVLAIPPGNVAPPDMRAVVCAVDDSSGWPEAMELAASFAPADAQFFVVGAVRDEAGDTDGVLLDLREKAPSIIATRSRFLVVAEKYFADRVARFADEVRADLIVTADPPARGIGQVLRATFAERLMQNSRCPILAVNTTRTPHLTHIEESEAISVF